MGLLRSNPFPERGFAFAAGGLDVGIDHVLVVGLLELDGVLVGGDVDVGGGERLGVGGGGGERGLGVGFGFGKLEDFCRGRNVRFGDWEIGGREGGVREEAEEAAELPSDSTGEISGEGVS